jgi:hypothetical protein
LKFSSFKFQLLPVKDWPEERKSVMESTTSGQVNEEKLEGHQDSLSHSYSCDGYERLHDEAMDKISVSIHYSDYEEAFCGNSRNSLTKASENHEKKMKISLSQEQLRLNGSGKNFLSVPKVAKKSASFSASDKKEKLVKIDLKTPITIESKIVRSSDNLSVNRNAIGVPSRTTSDGGEYDEIIYAVPRKNSPLVRESALKTSSASLALSKSVTIAQTSTASEFDGNFKYPLSFYCKLCSETMNDPRTLDCLHSFCVQCLARLDVSNDLQNNQFWRKISDSSSESQDLRVGNCHNLIGIFTSSSRSSTLCVELPNVPIQFRVRESTEIKILLRRKHQKSETLQGQGKFSNNRATDSD